MYLWDCFTHYNISLSPLNTILQWKKKITLTCYLSTLTYGAGSVAGVLLQEGDDLGLLSWWAAAADHSWTLTCQLHKLMLVISQTHLQTKQTYRISEVLSFYFYFLSKTSEIKQQWSVSRMWTLPYLFWPTLTFYSLIACLATCSASSAARGSVWVLCCSTSKESPEMTRAQSCFLLKALSSRWASPLFETCLRAIKYD